MVVVNADKNLVLFSMTSFLLTALNSNSPVIAKIEMNLAVVATQPNLTCHLDRLTFRPEMNRHEFSNLGVLLQSAILG